MSQNSKGKQIALRLAFSAMAVALAYVTSFIRLFRMPLGGSVTLFSMLFIALVGYWFGPVWGLSVGFIYGILQFLQGGYFLTPFQVCCDYLLTFAALGLSGFLRNKKHGLIKGYILGIIGRGFFAALAGYLYWFEYMPENFPESIKFLYPVIYNFAYILVEALITVIVLSLPPVQKAMVTVKHMAEGKRR
ncbi:MAG: energy-coupled thiamine transporter ThiT [Eubacterium sp.]|nr:energy-coupled thiamine transporter ThiT [Eubacterium sp.]